MSKMENLKHFLEKTRGNRVVTIMLLISFFVCFFCDDIKKYIFIKNDLATSYVN